MASMDDEACGVTIRDYFHRSHSVLPPPLPCPDPLMTFLGGDSPELVFTCLQHLQLLVARQSNLLQPQFKSFFCR